MESVIRGAAVYLFVWLIFRVSGKRTLSNATTFDLVLLLIISETTQEAMIADDNSMMNGLLIIVTLIGIDIAFSLWKQRSKAVERLLDGAPLLIVEDGRLIPERAIRSRISESDVMEAARDKHGLERLDQVKYAVLEVSGKITVVPK